MRGYSELEIFNERELRLFALAGVCVAHIPDDAGGRQELRCHEVARAVGHYLNLPVIDGKYGSVDHSWLLIETPIVRRRKILDVYSVARLPPVQIVDPHPHPRHGVLYRPRAARTDIREGVLKKILSILDGQFKSRMELLESIPWEKRREGDPLVLV